MNFEYARRWEKILNHKHRNVQKLFLVFIKYDYQLTDMLFSIHAHCQPYVTPMHINFNIINNSTHTTM